MRPPAGPNACASGAYDGRRIFTRTAKRHGRPIAGTNLMKPDQYFLERFNKFLTNDWVHLERKVAALEAKVHLLLGGTSLLIGLMIYAVTK